MVDRYPCQGIDNGHRADNDQQEAAQSVTGLPNAFSILHSDSPGSHILTKRLHGDIRH